MKGVIRRKVLERMEALRNAWNSLVEKATSEDTWEAIGESTFEILLILLITSVFLRVAKSAIRRIFAVRSKSVFRASERRETTMMKLLLNIVTYVTYFMAIMMILQNGLNYDVTGLIAGAGVVGLAIGFGAQNLVKDIISGFFIIFEDQFSVGDYVQINQVQGTVEEIGLRTTKVKSWTGELHIFPNGNILEVTNFSIHNSLAVVDVRIAYEDNIERIEKIITEFLETLPNKYEELVKIPEILGVQSVNATEVVLQIVAETGPMGHFAMGRHLRRDIKILMDEHNIEIPYPRMVMYSPEEAQQQQHEPVLGKE